MISRLGLPFGLSAACGALALLAGTLPAQARQGEVKESGAAVFKTYCASCHGAQAHGDGPIAQHLRTVPPDLTGLALRNKGKFEGDKVLRIIDGREPVKGHGGADMPVWGDAFKQSAEGYSEARVKSRIEAIVEYLESIQQRAP